MTGHYEHVFECGFECIMELEYEATKGHAATHESPEEAGLLEITDYRCIAIEGNYTRGKDEALFTAIENVFEFYLAANQDEIYECIWQRIHDESERDV